MTDALHHKLEVARARIRGCARAIVAFSAGVDSALLLKLAVDELGDRCLAVTAMSPSFPSWESAAAATLAQELGAKHRFVATHELERPGYVANDIDRCFHCKSELFEVMRAIAAAEGGGTLLYGANGDDVRDPHRPGQRAAAELGAVAPLAEAGLTKTEIRAASRELGLSTWDKPQLACLASRLPHGTPVTTARLRQVMNAEQALRREGFHDVRVRHHGEVGRIEIGGGELARFADDALRQRVAAAVKSAGFRFAALDLDGFRSGSLNPTAMPDAGATRARS